MHGLRDVRVVDLSTGIAGGYATKLFADAGADVVKVEPPDGDPLRRWSASGVDLGDDDGALFRFLHASKRSMVGAPDDPAVLALVADADLVVESFPPGVIDALDLLGRVPSIVVLSLSPFGRGGPWDDRPATEFTVQAACGSLGFRGRPSQRPLQAGGRIAEWAVGAYGAPAALAAVNGARRTGQGTHIDVSQLEAMTIATNLFVDLMYSLFGRPPVSGPARNLELPSIEPTADGWVGFNTNAAQQFHDFCVMIERPDLLDDPEMSGIGGRSAHADEWTKIIHAWTTQHTTEEIVELASLLRIPVAPVCNGQTAQEHPQFVARDVFVPDATRTFRHPRPPYLLNGQRLPPPGRAPALGEHTGAMQWRDGRDERPAPVTVRDAPAERDAGLAFDGLRVLDLDAWWAGPAVTQLLAALGADVVHVESCRRPDAMRLATAGPFAGRDRWWEWSNFFLSVNANKRGITLDLDHPKGVELAKRLVVWADVVVENFTPRVVEGFGLAWDTVHALNPRAVMLRMPAFGLTGPWRDHVGFAQTMEQVSGLAWITGYPDDQPVIPRGPCDPLGGMHGAFAIQVALAERDATGDGVLVEMPLVESALQLAAEQVIEYTAYGHLLERAGNRSPGVAPQGVYACKGDEQWLALSIATDAQWGALVAALGSPAWATDPALDTYDGRCTAHDRIDAALDEWATTCDLVSTVESLVERGVPAAAVADPRLVHECAQLVARGFYEETDHAVVGRHLVSTWPFRWRGIDRWLRSPAPTLGEHNAEVLTMLGLGDDEISALAADGVVGTRMPT